MEKAILLQEPRKYDLDSYGRVYIGNEFCQNLLPDPDTLGNRINYVLSRKKMFSIVTPYVTDYGLGKINRIFEYMQENYENPEIIVNDMGVLNLISRKYPSFNIALGRVIVHNIMKNSMTLRVNSDMSLNFFSFLNAKRIEISNKGPAMEVYLDKPELNKIKISLYYPYLFLSTGRRCVHGFPSTRAKKDFSPIHCTQKCRNQYYTAANRCLKHKIFIIGNAHFIVNKSLPPDNKLQGVDRLVYLPDHFFSK